MKVHIYIITLFLVSFLFFFTVASWFHTSTPYTDLVLTFIAVHLIMSKTVEIKKED